VEVEQISEAHRGLFAKLDIPAGTLIGCFAGQCRLFDVEELKRGTERSSIPPGNVVQLYREQNKIVGLVGLGDGFDGIDFINHSCHPNVTVINQIVLVTHDTVTRGSQLTVDYRIWDFIPQGIPCWCKDSLCVI
jgi:SET domain-containing protein